MGEDGKVRRSPQAMACGRETLKNLGDPSSSYTGAATGYGIQLLRHRRGNPETEQCWNLRAAAHQVRGRRRSTGNGNAHRMRLGSRIERSTLRWGKPTTRGRTRRKHAARKGHSSRTCRTGIVWPTSLRAIAIRVLPCTERVQPRNRMRENCTSGTARGAPGNRRSYRGGAIGTEEKTCDKRPSWQIMSILMSEGGR